MEETMNSTADSVAETVALLKEAVQILIHNHNREMTWEWDRRDDKRLRAIMEKLDGNG